MTVSLLGMVFVIVMVRVGVMVRVMARVVVVVLLLLVVGGDAGTGGEVEHIRRYLCQKKTM